MDDPKEDGHGEACVLHLFVAPSSGRRIIKGSHRKGFFFNGPGKPALQHVIFPLLPVLYFYLPPLSSQSVCACAVNGLVYLEIEPSTWDRLLYRSSELVAL